jgi:hypothetical protein
MNTQKNTPSIASGSVYFRTDDKKLAKQAASILRADGKECKTVMVRSKYVMASTQCNRAVISYWVVAPSHPYFEQATK